MNTLLGELATYNDIQYPRYRLAFKLRKLQTTFILHQLELSMLQDIFHSTGIQSLPAESELSCEILESITSEIYSCLKANLNLGSATLEEAHTTCFNWFVMFFQCDSPSENKGTVGILKIILSLFTGSKTAEKAKYLYNVLAEKGTVSLTGMQYFCETIQMLADSLQETIYPDTSSVNRAMSECLYHVRDEEDIEDEEEDGGLQRPWLSNFELIKAFTANPSLNFLSWMDLWFSLPSVEKVLHNVKCNVCSKKSIRGFRYQCEECSNYHMCQMCFLKGRMSGNHEQSHSVVECQDYVKSFKNRIGMNVISSKIYRTMNEEKEQNTVIRMRAVNRDQVDGGRVSVSSLHRLSVGSFNSPSVTPDPVYRPNIIRIGSKDSLNSPKREPIAISVKATHRLSLTSASSNESYEEQKTTDQYSSSLTNGLRKPSPIIPSIGRHSISNPPLVHRSLQRLADEGKKRTFLVPVYDQGMTKTFSHGHIPANRDIDDEFAKINKKLSMEVDQLLQDIEPQHVRSYSNVEKRSTRNNDHVDYHQIFTESLSSSADNNISIELDSLLGQVQNLHNEFANLQEGHKVSPLTYNDMRHTDNHQRTASLDMMAQKPSYYTKGINGHSPVVW